MVHVNEKLSQLAQITLKPCVHTGGHSFDPVLNKL